MRPLSLKSVSKILIPLVIGIFCYFNYAFSQQGQVESPNSFSLDRLNNPSRILIGEDRIYVLSPKPFAAIYAIDKNTGKIIWNKKFPQGHINGALNLTSKEIYLVDSESGNLIFLKDNGQDAEILKTIFLIKGAIRFPIPFEIKDKIYIASRQNLFIISAETKEIIGTLRIDGTITAMVIDKEAENIYLLDQVGGKLIIVNGIDGNIRQEIPVGADPTDLLFDSFSKKIFVTNNKIDNISVIDARSFSLISNIPTGRQPVGMALNTKTHKLYALNGYSHSLSIIDTLNNSVKTFDLPANTKLEKIAVDSERNIIYVEDVAANKLLIFNEKLEILGSVNIKRLLTKLAVDEKTGKLYASIISLDVVLVIKDRVLHQIIGDESMFLSAKPLLLNGPNRVLVDAKNNTVYVTNDHEGSLLAFDTNYLSLKNRLDLKDSPGMSDLRLVDKGKKIAVLSVNTSQIIITDGLKILNKIALGKSSWKLTEQSGKLYSSNRQDNSVSVIDINTGSVIKTVKVGKTPGTFRSHPKRNEIYVLNQGDVNHSISIINSVEDEVVGEIKFEGKISSSALDKTNDLLYVLQPPQNISIVDLKTREIIEKFKLGHPTLYMSHIPIEDKIYFSVPSKNAVLSWNVKTHEEKIINLPWEPYDILNTGPGKRIYVFAQATGLAAIEPKNDQLWIGATDWRPIRLDYDKKTNRVFVANYIENTISVLDADDYSTIATINSYGEAKWEGPGKISKPEKKSEKKSEKSDQWINTYKKIAGVILLGITLIVVGFIFWRRKKQIKPEL